MLRLSVAVAFLSSLAGCDLYWSDDPPPTPPPCYYGGGGEGAARPDHRNPSTGQCEPNYGGGGGCYEYGDDRGCGCYGYDTGGAGSGATGSGSTGSGNTMGSGSGGGSGNGSGGTAPDIAQWPSCYGACSNLDEASCVAEYGCHAAYNANARKDDPGDPSPNPMPADANPAFMGCWDIQPLPVVQGSCDGLDAYSCAMHDDCASYFDTWYGPDDGTSSTFSYCGAETASPGCALVDCEAGTHCEEQCYGDCPMGTPGPDGTCGTESLQCYPMCVPDYDYSCATVDCGPGYQCVEQCDGGGGGMDPADPTTGGTTPPGYCYPTCVEIVNAPGECYGDVWCDALPPACPANTTAGVANGCYTGYCIPVSDCGPQDPGSCEPATCAVAPPSCPSNSTAGVKNGCYTGYCIPNSSCPQVACEALTTEASCLGRMECTPVYTGDNCTCDANGVCHDCTSQSFDRCETWWF